MTSTPGKPKPSSRWGSLLSGAVANLESRLDTILADESTIAARNAQQQPATSTATTAFDRTSRPFDKTSTEQSRSSSFHRSNTPLSEVAQSSAPTSAPDARIPPSSAASTLVAGADTKPRSSLESNSIDHVSAHRGADVANVELEHEQGHEKASLHVDEGSRTGTPGPQSNVSVASDPQSRASLEKADESLADVSASQGTAPLAKEDSPSLTSEDFQAQVAQIQSEHETAELQRQEDVHSYLERIDALQSKLQYLAKEATESARQAASQAPPESLEKKLAAKDEQIAQLMQEGQQLSKAEVAQSTAARKLRFKIAEDSKIMADMKRKLASSERTSSELSEKVRKHETAQRDSSARLLRIPRLEREVESLKAARDEKESTIQALRVQLESESKRADDAAKQVNIAAAEEQRKQIASLQEDLSTAKIEKQLAEDRAKTDVKNMQDESQREQERNQAAELGLRNEISILETRLESLRARTEEASSGTTNDGQAKLLRQVETLQSQYAVARENWQGIESSLQGRVAALEKERSDIMKQEAEVRKKARESATNARRLQESLDETSRKCQVLEHDLAQRQANADKLESRVADFEKALKAANDKFEQERSSWDAALAARIEEERAKWQQEANAYPGPEAFMPPPESPLTPSRRSNTLELPGFAGRRPVSRNASTELSIPILEKTHSRRSSGRPGRSFDVTSPNGFDSGRSTPFFNGQLPETPSINEIDQDDLVETGSSPQRTVNDMISGSTSAAGPSVQLVERMSAKVRRLETEKAASKDELARISGQRDEARKEVVALMREIDQKRALDAKIAKLETGMTQVEGRYQTTLEMLGEKSERVEELEADVADLKKIYRELVESTMK